MDASIVAIIAVGVAILSFLASHFRTKGVAELDNRLGKLETKVELYFDFLERYNAQILHRDDDEHKLDRLLEKREQLEPVTPKESESLESQLEKIISDTSKPSGQRAAAAQMLAARKARHVEC